MPLLANTWRHMKVTLTCMLHHFVASMSARRHFDVFCPLGLINKLLAQRLGKLTNREHLSIMKILRLFDNITIVCICKRHVALQHMVKNYKISSIRRRRLSLQSKSGKSVSAFRICRIWDCLRTKKKKKERENVL